VTIHNVQEFGHRANLPLLAPRLDAKPLLQLWNQPHSIIVAVDMEIGHQFVVWPNPIRRNIRDSLKQLIDEIARLSHGAPRR